MNERDGVGGITHFWRGGRVQDSTGGESEKGVTNVPTRHRHCTSHLPLSGQPSDPSSFSHAAVSVAIQASVSKSTISVCRPYIAHRKESQPLLKWQGSNQYNFNICDYDHSISAQGRLVVSASGAWLTMHSAVWWKEIHTVLGESPRYRKEIKEKALFRQSFSESKRRLSTKWFPTETLNTAQVHLLGNFCVLQLVTFQTARAKKKGAWSINRAILKAACVTPLCHHTWLTFSDWVLV